MAERLSIEQLRQRCAQLPRVSLTHLPTPFQECTRLAESLGGRMRIFMKRDDMTSVGLGGNKVRKLEFALGEAVATGCDVIIHGLAGQSNYCRQTAAAAARLGLACHLVLRKDHKAGDPPQGNRLLDYVFGAHVRMVAPSEQEAAKSALVADLVAKGHKCYVVGHHDEVLGAVAYSLCFAEILEQQARAGVSADYVCVTGRSGTLAGLILGKRLLGFGGEILGFHPAPEHDQKALRQHTAQIANEAAALLGVEEQFTIEDVDNTSRYAGRAYGEPTDACLDALLLLGRTEGLVVGPVYTAKGLAGMMDCVQTGRIKPGSTAVYLHTGGTPEVFAYPEEIMQRLDATT